LHILGNFFWVNNHIFQYSFLLRDLFAPFNRLREGKFNIFSLSDILDFVIVNSLMRLIGFIVRVSVMVLGLIFLLITTVISIVMLLFWASAPFVLGALFYYGFSFIF